MKRLNQKIKSIGFLHVLGILFLAGLLLGTLFANLFRSFYIQDLFEFDSNYIDNVSQIEIDKVSILKISFIKNLREYMVTWILCITILGSPYIIWKVVYKGFLVGFLISTVTMRYGMMGIVLFLVHIIPQYILFIPVMLITYVKGFEMCKKLYFQGTLVPVSKRSIVMEYLPYLLIVFILLVFGSFLEAFVNPDLIKKVILKL